MAINEINKGNKHTLKINEVNIPEPDAAWFEILHTRREQSLSWQNIASYRKNNRVKP